MSPPFAVIRLAAPRPTRERIAGDLILIEGGAVAVIELRRATAADRWRLATYDLAEWWEGHALAFGLITAGLLSVGCMIFVCWGIVSLVLAITPFH